MQLRKLYGVSPWSALAAIVSYPLYSLPLYAIPPLSNHSLIAG